MVYHNDEHLCSLYHDLYSAFIVQCLLFAYFTAFRRRSGSCGTVQEDDRSSPFYSKKARYSFTDEQKNMLREAFHADPYPSTAAVDALALKMELSSKTVTNWFHNHRMRSKQQNREENGKLLCIKQEPDSNSLDGARYSSQNSYTTDSHNSSPDPSLPVASPDSTNPETSPGILDRSQSALNCSSTPNGNNRKRKNANPKYVSAGAVLDKHNSGEEDDGGEIDVTGLSETQPQSAAAQLSTAADAGDEVEDANRAKIARIEQRVTEGDLKWDDEVVDRQDCLQKLESQVNTTDTCTEDWEF